jgi:hypothetical protein
MRWAAGLGVALCFALGCGSDKNGPATGAGGATGTGGGSQGSGGNAATGGAAGSAGTPGGGSAGTTPLSCSGAWSAPKEILRPAPYSGLSSPTLSPDELEMFYVESASSGTSYNFRRSIRSTKAAVFPAGDVVPELDAACSPAQHRNIDLSRDGLRAYFSCQVDPTVATPEPLRIARRSAVGGTFVVDPQNYGMVGPSAAIGMDELELFSSEKTSVDPGPPRRYTRSSMSTAFGNPVSIPGLESVGLIAPELSPDGLSMFGAISLSLVVVERSRPDAAFAAPTVLLPVDPMTTVVGAPEIAQNCRSLYYVQNELIAATGTVDSTIRVMTR